MVVRNNLCYQNRDGVRLEGGEVLVEEGNLVGRDPKFVDLDGRKLWITAGSPAVDAGSPTDAPAHDHHGRVRPAGGGYTYLVFSVCTLGVYAVLQCVV